MVGGPGPRLLGPPVNPALLFLLHSPSHHFFFYSITLLFLQLSLLDIYHSSLKLTTYLLLPTPTDSTITSPFHLHTLSTQNTSSPSRLLFHTLILYSFTQRQKITMFSLLLSISSRINYFLYFAFPLFPLFFFYH